MEALLVTSLLMVLIHQDDVIHLPDIQAFILSKKLFPKFATNIYARNAPAQR